MVKVNDSAYCGLVVAKTRKQMYWLIDEFCDPNDCKIKVIDDYCGMFNIFDENFYDDTEVSETFTEYLEAGKFVDPKWTDKERKP